MCQIHLMLALLFRDEILPLFKWKLLWDLHKHCQQKRQVALIARLLIQTQLSSTSFITSCVCFYLCYCMDLKNHGFFVCYQYAHFSFKINIFKKLALYSHWKIKYMDRALDLCVSCWETGSWGSISRMAGNLSHFTWTLYVTVFVCMFSAVFCPSCCFR